MPEDNDLNPEQTPGEGDAAAPEPGASAPDESPTGETAPEPVHDAPDAERAIEQTQESVDELASTAKESSYSSQADSPAEEEALRVAQAAMAALNDEDQADPSATQNEIDALAAAQAALGSLNEETSPEDAAAQDAAAEAAMAAMAANADAAANGGTQNFQWQDFAKDAVAGVPESIDLLGDVNLNVKIELGRTRMLVEDVLRLDKGSVVELDKLAGDPVDIYVNGQPVARGEVLVLNDNFCVRINEILSPAQAEALRDVS
ncbi:MAG: flagellar motor switch protein FliN [Phycisphaerales bacterium]